MPEDGSRQIKWSLTQTKTKQLLIATRQKLQLVNQPTLGLYLNDNLVEEAEDEKRLSVRIDNHALLKPIFENCCSV